MTNPKPTSKRTRAALAEIDKTERIILASGESVTAGHQEALRKAEADESLKIPWFLSETEFLHGCEACPELLRQAVGMSAYRRHRSLLDLWIKIGRPHPAILREHLLGLTWPDRIPGAQASDSGELAYLVNWSWPAFNKCRQFARSQSTGNNASVAEAGIC